ncbi:hypothetical protein EV424DRAFT_1352672 [Suillus variegatus]|nr:hypothetical protein EV424DRAFT_1352672 [Suillus variegatus]
MNRPCVALTNNPGLKWKNPTPEPCAKPQTEMYQPPNPETRDCRVSGRHTEFRIPDTRTPKPETAGSRVSGVRNSELGRIWGDQTYRVPNSGHPNPETRDCQVSGIGCPELGTCSEFRTPDTRDPAVSGFGVRVSGIRNLGEFGEIKSI